MPNACSYSYTQFRTGLVRMQAMAGVEQAGVPTCPDASAKGLSDALKRVSIHVDGAQEVARLRPKLEGSIRVLDDLKELRVRQTLVLCRYSIS